ncbi:MAG: ATP-binding protein [Caulobacteraceae bacterium]
MALALAVSLISTTTALRLMIFGAKAKSRSGARLLMFGGACGGAGAWAANFIGLLAFEPGYSVSFRVWAVLASLIVPLVGGAVGVYVTARTRRPWNLPVWGVIFVIGVSGMQAFGLASLIVPGAVAPNALAFVASIVVGGALATLSLRIAVSARTLPRFLAAAATMSAAICGLHFIGMIGLRMIPDARVRVSEPLVSPHALALAVAGFVIVLVAIGLGILWLQISTRKHSLAMLQSIIEAVPQALAYFDADDRFVLGNATYRAELAEIGQTPVVGRRYRQFLESAAAAGRDPASPEEQRAMVEARLTARAGAASEFDQEMADGRFLRFQSNRTSLGGVVTIVSDITGLKRQAETLMRARDASDQATHAKSQFLATMSHEIRTPLNGVLGMVQAMSNDVLPKRQRERLDVIRKSGEVLLGVLNDVLDISKVEAGKLEIEAIAFDLDEVTHAVRDAFAEVATAKGLMFDVNVDDSIKGAHLGDPTRLRQILVNLISNAFKFTERGSVTLRVTGAEGDCLRFEVSDTGIGMSPDQVERLFQKFMQADPSTTRKFGGTGLGLAICHQLAILMGGALTAQSAPSVGSTFTLTVPLPAVDTDAIHVTEDAVVPPVADLRILVAEDNEVNQLVIRTLLGQVGIEPTMVQNGVQAVQAWAGGVWDLILMDVQMPQMDGPTATLEIRSRERHQGRVRTPIIALTANAMAHHVAEYREVGMDGFVAKPIDTGRLFAMIEEVLGASGDVEPIQDPAT